MDEKKVRETIEDFKEIVLMSSAMGFDITSGQCDLIIEALEKQLPKKPIIKSEKEVPRTHNLGRLLRFHCPNYGRFIVGM